MITYKYHQLKQTFYQSKRYNNIRELFRYFRHHLARHHCWNRFRVLVLSSRMLQSTTKAHNNRKEIDDSMKKYKKQLYIVESLYTFGYFYRLCIVVECMV